MRPPDPTEPRHDDLFRSRLDQIINMRHELVKLARQIDWNFFEQRFSPLYTEKGRPGIKTRLMVGLHLLKHINGLSDEATCDRWVCDPYFQYFCGETFFQHSLPIDRSSMTRWRQRIGADGMAALMQESLATAHRTKAISAQDMAVVTVDTTVQPKAISHPTDAKLISKAREKLVALAEKYGVALRQSFKRVGKIALIRYGRYAHAKQFKRAAGQLRRLKSQLNRTMNDICRKIANDQNLKDIFRRMLSAGQRVMTQKRRDDKPKIYSLHAPEVECIGKGKAHKPYEFGCKVTATTCNARAAGGQFVLHIDALHGNPYDGHTLKAAVETTEKWTGIPIKRVHVDKGYRGHGLDRFKVYRSGSKAPTEAIRREIKRRAAIEPTFGHMKSDGLLGRNFLKGIQGDRINAILCGAGYNFRLLLKWLRLFCAFFSLLMELLDCNRMKKPLPA